MEVTIIFKIAAVGILVSVLCQVLKHSGREEQAFLVSLAGLLMVLFWIVPYIYELFESTETFFYSQPGKCRDRKGNPLERFSGNVQIGRASCRERV